MNQKNTAIKVFGFLKNNIVTYYFITYAFLIIGLDLGFSSLNIISNGIINSLGTDYNGIPAYMNEFFDYFYFFGIWVILFAFIFIFKKNRPIFKAFSTKTRGNNWKLFLVGLAIGFIFNVLCILGATLNGDIHLYFNSFELLPLIFIFIAVFIQSSAEELICRGFLYQKLRKTYKNPWIAIVGNSLFFSLIHINNSGVTNLALFNIVVVGIFMSLMVYYLDSLWCAMAFHTAWNFNQAIVFGLPNSGNVSGYSLFGLDMASARDSFFYHVEFGVESTWFAVIILCIGALVIYLFGKKQEVKSKNIWLEEQL